MNNWRLLLFAFIAFIQPIASFTERSLVDGRQRCCDYQTSSLRDSRPSLNGPHRINPQDKRDRGDDFHTGPKFDTKRSILATERASQYRDNNEDTRYPTYRLTNANIDRRDLRQFDTENLDRRAPGKSSLRTAVISRYDGQYLSRISRKKWPALIDIKNSRGIASNTRQNFVQQKDNSELRQTITSREGFRTTRYEIEQERLNNRNNKRIVKERRTVNRLSSAITRVDNSRQGRRYREADYESSPIVSIFTEREGTPQLRQYEPNRKMVTSDCHANNKDTTLSNGSTNDRKLTLDKRSYRHVDEFYVRHVRFDTKRNTVPADMIRREQTPPLRRESERIHSLLYRETRADVTNTATIRREMRERVDIGSRSDMTGITSSDVSKREIETHQNKYWDSLKGEQKKPMISRTISNTETNRRVRFAVREDRNRNMNLRHESHVFSTIRRDDIPRGIISRDTKKNTLHAEVKRGQFSNMGYVENYAISTNSGHRESSQRDDKYRLNYVEDNKRRVLVRGKSQLVGRNNVVRELNINDLKHLERATSYIRRIEKLVVHDRRQNIRDEARRIPLRTRTETFNMRRANFAVRSAGVADLDSIHRHTRNEDRRRIFALSSQRSVDRREPIENVFRIDTNLHGMRSRGSREETRQTDMISRVESKRDTTDREHNRRTRSLDRFTFSDTTRIDRNVRSADYSSRSDIRQQMGIGNFSRNRKPMLEVDDTEVTRNRNTANEELNKFSSVYKMSGNWQIIFYILQGIYIYGVIVQAIKENGSTKTKAKNQYWWTMTSYNLVKVD